MDGKYIAQTNIQAQQTLRKITIDQSINKWINIEKSQLINK